MVLEIRLTGGEVGEIPPQEWGPESKALEYVLHMARMAVTTSLVLSGFRDFALVKTEWGPVFGMGCHLSLYMTSMAEPIDMQPGSLVRETLLTSVSKVFVEAVRMGWVAHLRGVK